MVVVSDRIVFPNTIFLRNEAIRVELCIWAELGVLVFIFLRQLNQLGI